MAGVPSLAPSLTLGRTDQGIDFSGAGPVFAPAPGTITRIGSGWYSQGLGNVLVYKLDSAPTNLEQYVYVAEDFIARAGLHVGSHVGAGDVLGSATGGSTGIEAGFSDAQGVPVAHSVYTEGSVTQAGQDFLAWVQKGVGGVVGGPGQPPPVRGATGTPGAVTHGSSDIVGAVKDVYGTIDSIPKFLGKITDPNLWLRILQIVGGSVLFLAGLYLLTKNVGLGVPAPAPAPVKKVAAAV